MNGKSWTDDDNARLAALVDECLTTHEVAAALGRTSGAVKAQMAVQGLHSKSRSESAIARRQDAALRRRWAEMIPGMKAALRVEIGGML